MHDFLSQYHIEEKFKWVFNECWYDLFGSTAGKFTILHVFCWTFTCLGKVNVTWEREREREMEN